MDYAGEKAASATDVPLCDECVAHSGLCARHRKSILPQLAQPFWYQLVGHTHHDERKEMSREARKIADRKRRKAKRRAELRALVAEIHPPQASEIRRESVGPFVLLTA